MSHRNVTRKEYDNFLRWARVVGQLTRQISSNLTYCIRFTCKPQSEPLKDSRDSPRGVSGALKTTARRDIRGEERGGFSSLRRCYPPEGCMLTESIRRKFDGLSTCDVGIRAHDCDCDDGDYDRLRSLSRIWTRRMLIFRVLKRDGPKLP